MSDEPIETTVYETVVSDIPQEKAFKICKLLGLDPYRVNRIIIDAETMRVVVTQLSDETYKLIYKPE